MGLRRGTERGPHGIPDEPRPVPAHPLPPLLVRPRDFRGDGEGLRGGCPGVHGPGHGGRRERGVLSPFLIPAVSQTNTYPFYDMDALKLSLFFTCGLSDCD